MRYFTKVHPIKLFLPLLIEETVVVFLFRARQETENEDQGMDVPVLSNSNT